MAIRPDWSATAGVRTTDVPFKSTDRTMTPTNPDDSGSVTYRKTTPVAALSWRPSDNLNVYASYGQGFETPTTTELAYRPDGTGINSGCCPPAAPQARLASRRSGTGQRLDAALFAIGHRQRDHRRHLDRGSHDLRECGQDPASRRRTGLRRGLRKWHHHAPCADLVTGGLRRTVSPAARHRSPSPQATACRRCRHSRRLATSRGRRRACRGLPGRRSPVRCQDVCQRS